MLRLDDPAILGVAPVEDGEIVEHPRLEAAVRQDLAPLIAYRWRQEGIHRQGRGDSQQMALLGVTVPVWDNEGDGELSAASGKVLEMKTDSGRGDGGVSRDDG